MLANTLLARVGVAVALCLGFVATAAAQDEADSAFPPGITFGAEADDRASDAIPPKQVAYISESVGSFAFDGKQGRAIYVWFHDLGEVDVHSHKLINGREEKDNAGNKYWVYDVDGHPDQSIYFAQRIAPDSGEAYRIFYKDHKIIHLWCRDATKLAYHIHRTAAGSDNAQVATDSEGFGEEQDADGGPYIKLMNETDDLAQVVITVSNWRYTKNHTVLNGQPQTLSNLPPVGYGVAAFNPSHPRKKAIGAGAFQLGVPFEVSVTGSAGSYDLEINPLEDRSRN